MSRRRGKRAGIIGGSVAAVVSVAVAGVLAFATTGTGHEKEEKAGPRRTAPAGPRHRTVDPAIAHASERPGKSLNITIDDGPDPVWTPKVLELLRAHDVKAVFCMIGPQARDHPELVRQVVADGHRLCDHTLDHNVGMDHMARDYQRKQIRDAQRMIEKAAGGARVDYYRAPGGAFTPYSRHLAARHGMRPLGWNIDSKDFELPGVGAITATVRAELPNGPTVLFHDGGGDRSQTLAALEQLLPWLEDQGYGFGFPER